jgi:acetyltransferase-like isoleucine patch superfamily enzyme
MTNLSGKRKVISASAKRLFQRYFVPSILVTLYYFIRYRCLISPSSKVQLSGSISFGKGTVVKPYAVIQNGSGIIRIGKKCSVNNFVHISNGTGSIILGDYVRIGPHVTILSSSRNFRQKDLIILEQGFSDENTVIEDDVLIASGAIILKGVRIGKGAVIGAGSVVTKHVPPYTIAVGTPAVAIGHRE